MDFKKSLKDVVALVIICTVFAAALAATNMLTKDGIADKRYQKELEAYYSAMPEGAEFDQDSNMDLTKYANLPASVLEVKKENNGMGYAVKVEVKGYGPGMIVIVGVSPDGIVYGATCPQSNETNGVEKTYGDKFKDLDMDGVNGVDVVAGSTMTTSAYKSAIVDAINAATIVGGGRTEEQKFADALNDALPAGNGEFEKLVLLAAVDGIDAIYEAANGEGYVCVIGTNSKGIFIGVDKDGNVVGDHTDEHKALAEAAIASVKANETVDIDLTPYQDNAIIRDLVNYVKKTGTGTYLVEIKTTGQYDSTTPIVLMVVIDANNCIVNIQTVSYGDNENPGNAQLADGKYNVSFVGKDQTGAGAVDTVAGVTFTTTAYKNAINNAFNVVALLKGGDDVDFRTEEEKFADAISEALPEANGEFTKYFKVEVIEGVDTIYVADNGAGYVCVFGTDSTGTFIGVGADGVALGENENNAIAEAAIAKVLASDVVDVDLTEFNASTADKETRKLFKKVKSVQKTASGNYIITITCDGFGKNGDHYAGPSGKSFIIKICISADGTILDVVTVEEYETPTIGGVLLQDGSYNSNFIGKDQAGAGSVDLVADCTLTTEGFRNGVLNAYEAMAIIVNSTNEGGTN